MRHAQKYMHVRCREKLINGLHGLAATISPLGERRANGCTRDPPSRFPAYPHALLAFPMCAPAKILSLDEETLLVTARYSRGGSAHSEGTSHAALATEAEVPVECTR